MFDARVKAVLGPTNTGKTHLAITRLLGHHSGIIGFPLRLLARENYERMVAAKGEGNVALITGEEKIVPSGARYFSCTVEAMPLDRRAEFVAVDEIQLCADPDRGHIFTDRLLHARGMVETMFLGAETIRPLLQRLVPQAEIETRPRLSQLAYAGPAKLTKLPPRSAIVAFSAAEVYAIAELIRRRRGGCAVVMGRLSPRTRNAQVALYQDKEVDFLVATDAIGMGLNMDVNHVAFAGLGKFDGRRPRQLTPAEVAQIAGRAGRGMRDGSFGTTGTCAAIPDEVVEAVETHRFDPIEQLFWRNADLDFASPDALLASLTLPPPRQGLTPGNEASDLETLASLAQDLQIRDRAQGAARTRLLWEACQIPDFRKIGDDSHTRFCARIFNHIVEEGRLPDEWLEQQLNALNRNDGDIDTLMQRLSGVRIWAYVAARKDWVGDSPAWQAKARDIEDVLSDALHERLTARFVDRRAAQLIRTLDGAEGEEMLSAVRQNGEVVVEGHPVGHVRGFTFVPDPAAEGPEKRLVLRAARRALRAEMPRRVVALAEAPDAAFGWTQGHQRITWDGEAVARLRRGTTLTRPVVEVLDSEFLDGPQREAVRKRCQTLLDSTLAEVLAPLFAAEKAAESQPELRGLLHRLTEEAGIAPGVAAALTPAPVRAALKALGVRAGRYALFLPALLKPRAAAWRATLLALRAGLPTPPLPREGLISLPRQDPERDAAMSQDAGGAASTLRALGWVPAGPVLLRLDIAERIAGELAYLTRRRPVALPPMLVSRLGLKGEMLPVVLSALGFRLRQPEALAEDVYGPPAPAMLSAARPAAPARPQPARPQPARPQPAREPQAQDGEEPRRHPQGRHPRRPHGQATAEQQGQAAAAARQDERSGNRLARHGGKGGPATPQAKPLRKPERPFVPAPDHPFAALAALKFGNTRG